jgi:16S rRNA (guanine966-N2)-methyltransferase
MGRVVREGPFDLVMADPPWALVDEGEPAAALADLVRAGGLTEDAVVVLEHAARSPPPDVPLLVRGETRRYGDTALTFYKPAILAPPRPPARPTSE